MLRGGGLVAVPARACAQTTAQAVARRATRRNLRSGGLLRKLRPTELSVASC